MCICMCITGHSYCKNGCCTLFLRAVTAFTFVSPDGLKLITIPRDSDTDDIEKVMSLGPLKFNVSQRWP